MNNQKKSPVMVRGISVEFSYETGGASPGQALVIVNAADSYVKTLIFANALLKTLRAQIPFKYKAISEPELHILSGQHKGILSVRFLIKFSTPDGKLSLSEADACTKLKQAGFSRGQEFILG